MAQLDTRQLVKDLIEGGLSDKLSDILGKAFFSSNNIESLVTREQFVHLEKEQNDIKTDLAVIKQTMSTKTDVAELKMELKEDISELRNELKEDISKLKNSMDKIDTNLNWAKALGIACLFLLIKIAFY